MELSRVQLDAAAVHGAFAGLCFVTAERMAGFGLGQREAKQAAIEYVWRWQRGAVDEIAARALGEDLPTYRRRSRVIG